MSEIRLGLNNKKKNISYILANINPLKIYIILKRKKERTKEREREN